MRQKSCHDQHPRPRPLPRAFTIATTLAAGVLVTSAAQAGTSWASPASGSLSAGSISGTAITAAPHLPAGAMTAQGGVVSPSAALPDVGEFSGMDATSATDVWAVGGSYAEHYNGKSWKVTATPSISGGVLASVSADSASDAWATGYVQVGTVFTPLAEHWNGKTWTEADVPNIGSSTETIITSVAAISPSDAWAAGYYYPTTSSTAAFIDHWDGSAWTTVTSADPGEFSTLTGISADSATDVWATGLFGEPGVGQETFAERWNGTNWAQVTTPNAPDSVASDLVAVTALSPANAWAEGYSFPSGGGGGQNLSEHWNGRKWAIVPSPNPVGAVGSYPFAVSAQSRTDVWAAGSYEVASGEYLNLVEHWDGTQWSASTISDPSGSTNYLYAVAPATHRSAWTGGFYVAADGSYVSSVYHWNGQSWVQRQANVG